jgi:alpha-N-arabinofuranosidase
MRTNAEKQLPIILLNQPNLQTSGKFMKNSFLSPKGIEEDSQGGAYAHNLIAGGIDLNSTFFDGRKTPFHKAHSTEVVALHDNPSGDSHYDNNLL